MNPLQSQADHRFNPFEPHPEIDGVDVPGPGNIDWTNDSDPFGVFSARGMPPPKSVSPTEVKQEASERSGKIFANFHLLQSIVERHEATIRKRWEKKTKTQRLAMLLEAWPGMPPTHRPDFAAFRKQSGNLNAAASQHRQSLIWPSINQEDLSEPKTLPLLLNARGRNHPNAFVAVDGEAMHIGKVSMAIVPVFLNEHVMMLNGMSRQADYGRLVSWNENDQAFEWMHTRKQFLPGEGLLILEFQDRLLEFLVHCCQKILHEIPLEQLTSDDFSVEPEPPLKASIDTSGFLSLATMAKEAPYRVPLKLDLEKIQSLLAARTASAEDHIWALREDPSYFADKLLDMKEHRQEMIKDIYGDAHPTLKPPRDGLLWARVIGSLLVGSFFQLESFTELRDQATRLHSLLSKYESQISPLTDLPEEYLGALLKFRHYLNQVAKGALNQLKMAVVASPPLRNLFVRSVPVSATSSMMEVMSKPGVKLDKVTGHLIWLLRTLWEDGTDLFLCRLTTVIDELDRLLRAESKALELVSPYVAMLIGELSIVGECLRQLEIYQPWANGFEGAMVEREGAIKNEFAQRTKIWGQVLDAFRDQKTIGLRQLGDPSGGKFQYPVGKRHNKAVVETLRTAEAHLDTFWTAVDKLLHNNTGDLNGTAYKKLLSQPRYLQRTPEWIEPATKKTEVSKQNQGLDVASSSLVAPLSHLQITIESPLSGRKEALAATATKSKIKSRGTPGAPSVVDTDEAIGPPGSVADIQPIFAVDSRALKVFRIVFFDASANTTAGEVAWRDFLHAMDSTGFTAQKLYGSVWHFQPTKLDVERSIQFHEPHPRGKIPFLVARRHGRRLNRAYGWDGKMFVLKDKINAIS